MAAGRKSLVIVANRLPVVRKRTESGEEWTRSPGGLVSALTPIVQRSQGFWIGWTGKTGRALKPFEHDGISQVPVRITRDQLKRFYEGFCNGTIWPLYHGAVREPEYHRRWWRPYVAVNRHFSQVTAEHAPRNARVWIHDYHLQLAPAMLRELRPDLRIGYFLHIPFPPEELFGRLPWRRQILEGLLGADVVGFQTQNGVQNFARSARRFADAKSEKGRVKRRGRTVEAGAFPISCDFERYSVAAEKPSVKKRIEQIKQQLGGGRKIILGVDRLDYTKGIDVRLRAFRELLSRHKDRLHESVFVQVAVPSREQVPEYRELASNVAELVGQINGEFGEVGFSPIHYLHRGMPFEELIALYAAAEVMVVTPLADGMNLVAKEYVAVRNDDTGALVLSEFAGAAHELRWALQVNPHDVDGVAETMEMALSLPKREVARRMRRMRKVVMNNTVYDWANRFTEALTV